MLFRLTVGALVGCAAPGAVTPAMAIADCECWHYVRAEGATANTAFSEVAAPSFDTALAVGSRGSRGMPLLARWNGVRWWETPLPVPAETRMEGVAASSTRDGWAVGHTPDGRAQAIRWTGGQSWHAVPMPTQGPGFPRAVEARSADDAWIVGSSGHTAQAGTWHWNGHRWQAIPVPRPPGLPADVPTELVAVSALATDDVWAVGGSGTSMPWAGAHADQGRDRFSRALAAHWDGRVWTPVPLPETTGGGPLDRLLSDVIALDHDDVWAVGTGRPSTGHPSTGRQGTGVPLAQHWNGRGWQTMPLPWPRGRLYSVAGDGRGVWVAGESATGTALLAHWNGERWDVSGVPTPGDPAPGEGTANGRGSGAVRGLANARGTSYLWAVGAYEQPGTSKPVRHLLAWTNAPHRR